MSKIAGKGKCPYCEEDNLVLFYYDFEWNKGIHKITMRCENCQREFVVNVDYAISVTITTSELIERKEKK